MGRFLIILSGIIPAIWFIQFLSGKLSAEHSTTVSVVYALWLWVVLWVAVKGGLSRQEGASLQAEHKLTEVARGSRPGFWERRALAQAARAEAARHRKEERADQLEQARSGPLVAIEPRAALLRKGEIAHASVFAALRELRTVGYRGRSSGLSFRVAKGVTIRTGGHGGGAVRRVVEAARGELVVTNQRVLFAGDQKSLAVKLDDLVSINFGHRTLLLGTARKTYELAIGWQEDFELFRIVLERLSRRSV